MATSGKNLSSYDPGTIPPAGALKIAIVVSEWNEQVTGPLSEGARTTLIQHGVKPENLLVQYVPGSFELPIGARFLIDSFHPDAVILIGCVIRGETPHFDFISQAVAQGCMQLGLETGIPVIFGVLTTNNLEQALDRAGGRHGNKGTEAAVTAIRMASLKNS